MSELKESFVLLLLILLPAAFAAVTLAVPAKGKGVKETLLILGATVNLVLGLAVHNQQLKFEQAWAGWDMDFSLRLVSSNGIFLAVAAVLMLLVAIYAVGYSTGKPMGKLLPAGMLFLIAMVNGSLLANNLVVLLFFWQAIWAPLFVMMMFSGKDTYKVSLKALAIAAVGDLCIMFGTGFFVHEAHGMVMDGAAVSTHHVFGALAFLLFMVGAVAKAGALPFGHWITKASEDAPAPFMAILPGVVNTVLGFYLLRRITTDLFAFESDSWLGLLLLIIGAGTLLVASAKALLQTDLKRGVSFLAIAQAGALIFGIGALGAYPYLLLIAAAAVSGLYMAAGAVEAKAGTTELKKLGGLSKTMPMTLAGFLTAAVSMAVLLPAGILVHFGRAEGSIGFFGIIVLILALLGVFAAVAALIRLGHTVFFGESYASNFSKKAAKKPVKTKDASQVMLWPLLLNAATILVLWILTAVQGSSFQWIPVLGSLIVPVIVFAWYSAFAKKAGKAPDADELHRLPAVGKLLAWAGKPRTDTYTLAGRCIRVYANASLAVNDGISRFYDVAVVNFVGILSGLVKKAHNGSQSRYVLWVLFGSVITVVIFLMS